jgi:phospholipase A1
MSRWIAAVQAGVFGCGLAFAGEASAERIYSLGEIQPFAVAQSGREAVAAAAPAPKEHPAVPGEEGTAMERRFKEEAAVTHSRWAILPHRPNYILPYTYNDSPNNEPTQAIDPSAPEFDNEEAKFQISFKLPLWEKMFGSNADLYFAYTQISLWQVYNRDNSSPFRDTNYEPEGVVVLHTDYDVLGFKNRQLAFGLVHQSNGRGMDELSRSWNRIYVAGTLERGSFASSLKVWYRIPEDEEDDDNPDIEDYLGNGELRMGFGWRNHVFATMLRNNLQSDNKGAVELDWSFPLLPKLKGYVQVFYGYGESLIDYDHKNERVGVGVLLSDWL